MKKLIALVLSSLSVMSALASCAPAAERLDASVSLASSDAAECAAWLDERLDAFPTDVIVGIGSNEEYGVDMTDFEADGYVLRTIGEETFIFGASADGLDRAVRKYAKAAEAGTVENLDETYHEGYRIKRLTIAGNDISEYTVYLPADRNASVDFAAEELVRLVNKACGVTLSIKEGTPSGKYFTFAILDDDSINDAGYKYKVENGNVLIEGKDDFGCPNGVYRFLEEECGWEDLCFGDSFLMEAEHVDVKDGISFVGNPRLNYYTCSGSAPYTSDRIRPTPEACDYGMVNNVTYNGRIRHANHGMWTNGFMPYTLTKQPCYLDKWMYEDIYEMIIEHIEAKLAAGQTIGKEFKYIDLSQPDLATYCVCADCSKMLKKEDGAHVWGILQFANRIDDELPEEYEGLKFFIFAYLGAQKPCVTPPNADVYVTFCSDHCCSNHPLSEACTEVVYNGQTGVSNSLLSQWLKKWCEISPNIYVWHYALDNALGTNNHVDIIYEDMNFFSEIGVYGLYTDFEYLGYGEGRITSKLAYDINWDRDITKEEYLADFDRLLKKEFGDNWEYAKKCYGLWAEGEERNNCWTCWDLMYMYVEQDAAFASEHFDEVYEAAKKISEGAETRKQEIAALKFLCIMIYQGSVCSYFDAYDANDTARLAVIEERWAELVATLKSVGLDTSVSNIPGCIACPLGQTCEEHMWTQFGESKYRDEYTSHDGERRSSPEKYQ